MSLATDQMKEIEPYLRQFKERAVLNNEQVGVFFEAIRRGDQFARDILIEHNIRLVVKISMNYVDRLNHMSDLINLGTIGLIKAISCYEPKLSTFSTWAYRYITKEIYRYRLKENDYIEEKIEDTNTELLQLVPVFFMKLSPLQKSVLSLQLGLDGDTPLGRNEIGKRLDLSRGQVEQIERRAIDLLQSVLDPIA